MKTRACFKLLCLLLIASAYISQVYAAQTLLNETVTVSNLGYRSWRVPLDVGDRLTGSMYGSGDVNFYILDSSDYADFSSGRDFYASYSRSRVSSLPSIAFTVPSSGTWYIVLDNQYSFFTSKSVSITIYLEPYSQPAGSSPDSSGALLVTIVTIIAIVAILVLAVVGVLAYSAAIKKKPIENVPRPPS